MKKIAKLNNSVKANEITNKFNIINIKMQKKN
jgi:hypothetical protein